jgi:hypothetical protein
MSEDYIGTIYFENEAQRAIWVCELLGQMSDGIWENEDVDVGFWESLKPEIDPKIRGWRCDTDRIPTCMGVDASRLIEFVDDRCIDYVRLAKAGCPLDRIDHVNLYSESSLPDKLTDEEKAWLAASKEIDYDRDQLWDDLFAIREIMGNSLRKIGYID